LVPENYQHIAIINTILGLLGAVVFAFLASKFIRGEKFNVMDIQRATIAGGITMGSLHCISFTPLTSMIMGCLTGIIVVLGLSFGKEFLWRTFYIHDSNGNIFLHLIPGFFSMVLGAISGPFYFGDIPQIYKLGSNQVGFQFAGLGVTVGLSLFSIPLALLLRWFFPDMKPYRDKINWVQNKVEELDEKEEEEEERVNLIKTATNNFRLKEFSIKLSYK